MFYLKGVSWANDTGIDVLLVYIALESDFKRSRTRKRASLRTADAFPVVVYIISPSEKIFFAGREATVGDASAVRRLQESLLIRTPWKDVNIIDKLVGVKYSTYNRV